MKIVGIPFSAGGLGKTEGCEKAPEALIEVLGMKKEFMNLEVDNGNISDTNDIIFTELQKGDFPNVIIGGDHSITYSCVKAFSQKFENVGMIIFDAHPDVENNFSPPSHEDYLKVLIEEGVVEASKIVLVAEREGTTKERKYLEDNGILFFDMKKIKEIGVEDACDAIMEKARSFGNLYISVDIDAVDPAFAPGTGYICPGGLSSTEMLYFVQRLKLLKNLRCVDVVEINPAKDSNGLTVNLGAKIVKDFISSKA